METDLAATLRASREVWGQQGLVQHIAAVRGDMGALARLGSTRPCRTPIARRGVFVERHRAGEGRGLSGAQGDLRAVGQPLVTPLWLSLGRWDALLAAAAFRQAACRPPVVGQTASGPTPQDRTTLATGPPTG